MWSRALPIRLETYLRLYQENTSGTNHPSNTQQGGAGPRDDLPPLFTCLRNNLLRAATVARSVSVINASRNFAIEAMGGRQYILLWRWKG